MDASTSLLYGLILTRIQQASLHLSVAQMIKEEGQPAVDRWLDVLRAGGTMKPLELMKRAGVDMSKPDAIRKAVSYVGSLIDELERSYQ